MYVIFNKGVDYFEMSIKHASFWLEVRFPLKSTILAPNFLDDETTAHLNCRNGPVGMEAMDSKK